MKCVIELANVTKRYGARTALDDLTLNIQSGITGLLGPNGSGKSTLIKALLGLVNVQAGSMSVLGFQLPKQIRSIRDAVGYLPEDDCYIAGLTGIESVHFFARLAGLPHSEGLRRAHEILDFSDVAQERYRAVETYSTGMRQKLKFAQALVHDPQLLILDEPTTGLDPQQRVAMLRRITSLSRKHGKSVLLSTHILHDVKEVCDQVIILANGRVRTVDSLNNLSRPAQPGMRVQISESSQVFAQKLLAMGLEVQAQGTGSLWVSGVTEQDCQPIWDAAAEAHVSICSLEPARNSLEQVFFETIREPQHAAT